MLVELVIHIKLRSKNAVGIRPFYQRTMLLEVGIKRKLTFLGNEIPLTRREVSGYLQTHEAHSISVAETLGAEISSVAVFVQRAWRKFN